jgi:hypothetical protein
MFGSGITLNSGLGGMQMVTAVLVRFSVRLLD